MFHANYWLCVHWHYCSFTALLSLHRVKPHYFPIPLHFWRVLFMFTTTEAKTLAPSYSQVAVSSDVLNDHQRLEWKRTLWLTSVELWFGSIGQKTSNCTLIAWKTLRSPTFLGII